MSDDEDAPKANLSDRDPRLGSPAFICPHCKAFAQQRWYTLTADVPNDPPRQHDLVVLRQMVDAAKLAEKRGDQPDFPTATMDEYVSLLEAGLPVVERNSQGHYVYWSVSNAHLSTCFVCEKASLWVAGRVRFPVTNAEVPEPNEDLPGDIKLDFSEAGEVVAASPRAAAALLRLAIQKLCSHVLGQAGDINAMIGLLVTKGLSPRIQKALDVVRVIGNEAVHPGTIDLRDDQATAMQLFRLVNLIADVMISQPKHIDAIYGKLPPNKLEGIEQRDAKAAKAVTD